MPISFPSSPSSGQRYEFSFNAWTYNGTFWQSTGSSGQITSGVIGDNAIFSGNIASGSISAFNLASGVGGSSLVLTSGSITSGFIGNDAVTQRSFFEDGCGIQFPGKIYSYIFCIKKNIIHYNCSFIFNMYNLHFFPFSTVNNHTYCKP